MRNALILSLALSTAGATFAIAGIASAQDLGALKSLGGMSSMSSGSAGNAAGIIEFCVKNNYLSGDAASSMKDKLLGKIGGGDKADQDPGYVDGAKGMLTGGDGKTMNLADMGGLKKKVTKKACESVLTHSKSLL